MAPKIGEREEVLKLFKSHWESLGAQFLIMLFISWVKSIFKSLSEMLLYATYNYFCQTLTDKFSIWKNALEHLNILNLDVSYEC